MVKKKKVYGEGSVTQRKDGRYQVSVPGIDGKRRYGYADSEKDAEKLRRQLLSEVEQGKLPASKQPFRALYEEWLRMRKRDFKPNTYLSITYLFRTHYLPTLGDIPGKGDARTDCSAAARACQYRDNARCIWACHPKDGSTGDKHPGKSVFWERTCRP